MKILLHMSTFNFHKKTFSLIANAKAGTVNRDTVFEFEQDGTLVTADYYGGTVIYGKIIGQLTRKNRMEMRYQCLTSTNELQAGKATAKISLNPLGKIKLSLNWQWLDGNMEKGTSEYIEN